MGSPVPPSVVGIKNLILGERARRGVEEEDVELPLSPHKHVKRASTYGIILTESYGKLAERLLYKQGCKKYTRN